MEPINEELIVASSVILPSQPPPGGRKQIVNTICFAKRFTLMIHNFRFYIFYSRIIHRLLRTSPNHNFSNTVYLFHMPLNVILFN